jgi:hypothetical protein
MEDDEAVVSASDVLDSGGNGAEEFRADGPFGSDDEVSPRRPEDGIDVVVLEKLSRGAGFALSGMEPFARRLECLDVGAIASV